MAFNDLRSNSYPTIIDASVESTASLLAKVLAITAGGFFVTAFGVATAPEWGTLVGMLAVLGLVFSIPMARRSSPGVALTLFFVLAYFMGWEIGPLVHRYILAFGSAIVFNAAVTTGAGMAVLGCVAYLFHINYRRITGYAMAGLLVLMVLGILSMFFHFMQPSTYSWLTLLLFTFLTVADFARIRAGGDGQSAVMLALSIYLDGINIFLAVLQLFGGRRRD
ncbi:MAG: US12 family protein [Acidobacteriota bacterium]|nr:US12 family protein [Acidobacteriota bacterium]